MNIQHRDTSLIVKPMGCQVNGCRVHECCIVHCTAPGVCGCNCLIPETLGCIVWSPGLKGMLSHGATGKTAGNGIVIETMKNPIPKPYWYFITFVYFLVRIWHGMYAMNEWSLTHFYDSNSIMWCLFRVPSKQIKVFMTERLSKKFLWNKLLNSVMFILSSKQLKIFYVSDK